VRVVREDEKEERGEEVDVKGVGEAGEEIEGDEISNN